MKLNKSLTGALVAASMAMSSVATAADIVIGVPDWPSVAATASILKVVIEDNFGLEVELQNATNPVVFEAMDSGSMHIHPEVWLPNQSNLNNTFVKQKKTVVQAPNGTPAFQSMCVTRGYDETMELMEMDETLAMANVDTAVAKNSDLVFFCYTPNHVFALHDLVILEEPAYDASKWKIVQPTDDPNWLEVSDAPVAWDLAYLHIHYAASLRKDHPDVASMLDSVKFTTDLVSEMTYALVVDKLDADEYAIEWAKKNSGLVDSWLK